MRVLWWLQANELIIGSQVYIRKEHWPLYEKLASDRTMRRFRATRKKLPRR